MPDIVPERGTPVDDGRVVILTLKIAVVLVTLIFLPSLLALWKGNYKLHGRINWAFFSLTATALIALEVVVRLINPRIFDYFDSDTRLILTIHLCFSLPAAVLMMAML